MLRWLHRLSALVIGAYAQAHLINHLVGLRGADKHIAFMYSVRAVVRLPPVEALLLACIAYQVGVGAGISEHIPLATFCLY